MVSCKLARSAIKGHDTANNEGAQLRWVLTSELVGLGHFVILFTMTRWACIVLLVGWPWAWWIANRVLLCRGRIGIGHRAPAARGITKVLGWYCWWCDWGFLEGWHKGCNWSRQHWE